MTLVDRARRVLAAFAEPMPAQDTDQLMYPAQMFHPLHVSDEYGLEMIDDLVAKKGVAVYRDMMRRDDMVQSSTALLTLATLSAGWELSAAGDDDVDQEALRLTQKCFDDLEGNSVTRLLQDSMEAPTIGFSCIEQVWRDPYVGGEFAGRQVYRKFVPRPQETITFKTDEHGEIEPNGIWQANPRQMVAPGLAPEYFRHYPRDRFIIWSWLRQWNNPLGLSLLRPAYRWYKGKEVFVPAWLRHLEYHGSPRVMAETSATGTALTNLIDNLRRWQSQLVGAIQTGTKLTITEPGTSASANYQEFLSNANRSIARAILQPALLMEGGESTGSNALGQSHKGTFEWVMDNLRLTLTDEVMREQVIRPLITHNFGPDVAAPKWKFKSTSEPDRVAIATMLKTTRELGLPLAQKDIYAALSLPVPDDDAELLGGGVPTLPGAESDEPGAQPQPGAAGDTEIQKRGLNGAQIGSIQALLQAVADREQAGSVVRTMLREAFPLMNQEAIDSMVTGAESHTPEPADALGRPDAEPDGPEAQRLMALATDLYNTAHDPSGDDFIDALKGNGDKSKVYARDGWQR